MVTELRVGQQLVRIDTEATAALYSSAETRAGADECTCASCRNFAEQRATAFPNRFVVFLRQLGVDPAKELEAFDYDFTDVEGMHPYGGWFLLRGEIVDGAAWRPETEPGAFTYWFTDSFPSGGLPREVRFVAVEFCTNWHLGHEAAGAFARNYAYDPMGRLKQQVDFTQRNGCVLRCRMSEVL